MTHAYSPQKQGPSVATSDPPPTPRLVTSQTHDSQNGIQPFIGEVDPSNQPLNVKSTLTGKFPLTPTQQLQFHTPARQNTDTGLGAHLTPSPPVLSPYIGPHVTPVQVPIVPSPVITSATPPAPHTTVQMYPNHLFQPQGAQQPAMNEPATAFYPTQVYQHSTHHPTSYVGPSSTPQAPTSSLLTPHPMEIRNTHIVGSTPQGIEHGQIPQSHVAQSTFYHPQNPLYASVTNAWGPTAAIQAHPTATHAAFDHSVSPHVQATAYKQHHAPVHQVNMYPDAVPRHTPSLPPTAYGGFLQTHQVKNVQVFTGNADSRVLVEDWVRDMQYLLEAIELPPHLRFSTVVRHLGGEARKLILNLPPHDQTPEMAFEELRAEYGDTQGSLDPLADFYERSQRPGETACSYAIALEATLRAVEETQRGGKPFPDRDSKLTRQFLRGLIDEDVYMRISPMKPRLLSFRELQDELRNLAKETRKFQPQNKPKRTYSQVQVTSEGQTEKTKHTSEWSELTELVKKLALCQEEQMTKLAHLESRFTSPFAAPLPPSRVRPPPGPTSAVTCHRCGKQGHIARVCRAVLPDASQAWAHQPLSSGSAEATTPRPPMPLNG